MSEEEMGKVIPFRRPPIKDPPVWSDGTTQDRCDEIVHVFESIPGRCQCGSELWESLDDQAPGSYFPPSA